MVVSIEQNKEFHESRVDYTYAGIKSLFKIGEGGEVRNPWNPPQATPLNGNVAGITPLHLLLINIIHLRRFLFLFYTHRKKRFFSDKCRREKEKEVSV